MKEGEHYVFDRDLKGGRVLKLPDYLGYQLKRPLRFTLEVMSDQGYYRARLEKVEVEGVGRNPRRAVRSAIMQLFVEAEQHTRVVGPLSQHLQRVHSATPSKKK